MKRSEINARLIEAMGFVDSMNFKLPPFAFWNPEDWAAKGGEYDEIRDNMLGWDITDYGSGDFMKIGLLLFTIRNGNSKNSLYAKPYAEKLLLTEEGQIAPFHFHWNKMEDIINRGGGNLLVKVYNSTRDGAFSDAPVPLCVDGRRYTVDSGAIVRLTPGESITLTPGMYHKFWGEPGAGKVLLGEVSMVNDDQADNRFFDRIGRFPTIEEDEAPRYLLVTEYPRAKA
jgi:D-lyxose ketol-isomerase